MHGQSGILLDTGVLVALLHSDDGRHEAATRWLAGCSAKLHTVEAVLTETAFFLPARRRATVADLAAKGTIDIHRPDATAYKRVGAILGKYADLDPDWADAMLVWLAEETGIHSIATFDVRDFSAYRIHGRSKFVLEPIT
ncbi:type II toxin-antitoxin system VapC family toxin [Ramlibacter sp. WS9]|uniref:type II toxin-antitoxin system VapC family toxin n=1 Tax=Ramlibacter sp. WS9 TaxID=1882741 RepID=UPI00114272C3|nr:type II toxin-antitoxin system VapC family toxin [Ramlibacter sp. WS9]ROZ76215.1 PIN domain-containing protein [Ramlibacter sp. WS9]